MDAKLTTREKLLQAAKDILMVQGWDGTSGRAIQRKAKVSRGSWTYAFPRDKAQAATAIYQASHQRIWARSIEAFQRANPRFFEATTKNALDRLIESLLADEAEAHLYLELDRALRGTPFSDEIKGLKAAHHAEVACWLGNTQKGKQSLLPGEAAHALIFAPALTLAAQDLSLLGDHTVRKALAEAAGAALEVAVTCSARAYSTGHKKDSDNNPTLQL
jgi:AcrR family transcriptional regulator